MNKHIFLNLLLLLSTAMADSPEDKKELIDTKLADNRPEVKKIKGDTKHLFEPFEEKAPIIKKRGKTQKVKEEVVIPDPELKIKAIVKINEKNKLAIISHQKNDHILREGQTFIISEKVNSWDLKVVSIDNYKLVLLNVNTAKKFELQ